MLQPQQDKVRLSPKSAPVRGVVSLEHCISTAEAGAVDVDLPHHAAADKPRLLDALNYSANEFMPHWLAVARDIPPSYLNVLQAGTTGARVWGHKGYAAGKAQTCAAVWCNVLPADVP
jgi:hypothetical protein